MKITEQNKDILWESHGIKFKGSINGIPCDEVVAVDKENNRVVLCQNVVDGVIIPHHLLQGYDFESLEMDIKTVRTRNPIQDAIDYLKSNGYKVLKAEWHEV